MTYTKKPSPKTPNTMDGTPARLLTAMRTARTSGPCLAYSRRYSAATTPNGTTTMLMMMTIITVPKMAGKTPPSVLASRGSSQKNSQKRVRYRPMRCAHVMSLGRKPRTTPAIGTVFSRPATSRTTIW